MRNSNIAKKIKKCPFFDENCLKDGCEIYNEMLDQCDISLVAYNLFLLTTAMKSNLEKATEPDL